MATPNPNPKLKILLVDDDPDTRELVTMMFSGSGHKLLTAASGKAALNLLEHEKVDLILLDIMMPELDGLMMLESVRRYSAAPILMLTALSDPRIMEQSYLLGADDYIVKPFTKSKLLERVERMARQLTSFAEDGKANWRGDYQIDFEKSELSFRGRKIEMTSNELRLLARLMDSAFLEVSTMDLYEAVWGREPLPLATRQALVENAVAGLREKLESDPRHPKILVSSPNGWTFFPA